VTIPIHEVNALDKKMTALFIPNAIQVSTPDAKYTFASFMSRDTVFDVIFNVWRLARPDAAAGRLGGPSDADIDQGGGAGRAAIDEARVGTAAGKAPGGPAAAKKTACACGTRGEHYAQTAMDVVLPGTPEKIYNLMFASGFVKDFMRDNQKLMGARRRPCPRRTTR
jgi:hypothetical protein